MCWIYRRALICENWKALKFACKKDAWCGSWLPTATQTPKSMLKTVSILHLMFCNFGCYLSETQSCHRSCTPFPLARLLEASSSDTFQRKVQWLLSSNSLITSISLPLDNQVSQRVTVTDMHYVACDREHEALRGLFSCRPHSKALSHFVAGPV